MEKTSLSTQLRNGTTSVHRLAERSGIMREILGGRLSRNSYVDLLRGLVIVYDSLEQALAEHRDNPLLRPLELGGIARARALEADLAFLHGPEWKTDIEPSAAALDYAHRARTADAAQLVAHAYVRYLGDMSGGQALRKVVGRSLKLEGSQGLSFYDFPNVSNLDDYKQKFRVALDALPLDQDDIARVVTEAVDIFGLNIKLFEGVATQAAA